MYSISVQHKFNAQHYLIGGEWGTENQLHSHHYTLELILEGAALDQHGYLVDIVEIEAALEEQAALYRDRTLNELPPFVGLNPSIEHFCRIVCQALSVRIQAPNLSALTVKLWENDIAWAAYRSEFKVEG